MFDRAKVFVRFAIDRSLDRLGRERQAYAITTDPTQSHKQQTIQINRGHANIRLIEILAVKGRCAGMEWIRLLLVLAAWAALAMGK